MRVFLLSALLVLSVAGAVGALFYREFTQDLPSVRQLASYGPQVSSQVYAVDGTLIDELYFEKRYLVPFEGIPVVVRQAFLAAEDSTFYEHHGIDLTSIVRAFRNNLRAGNVTHGASTITQQVVKALLLTSQRSYERKIKEIILARRMERLFTKDEILWLYLNQIYLGDGAYGVGAAADVYFGKVVSKLTLAEASLIAGLPQAPTRYSPTRHPERAKVRQGYVLRQMEKAGFITAEEREKAFALPVATVSNRGSAYRQAPDYVEYVRRALEERYGNRVPYRLGLRIFTAVDMRLQAAAEQSVRDGLEELDRRRGYRGPLRRLTDAEAESSLERKQMATNASGFDDRNPARALVVKSAKDHAVVRLGSRTAVLPTSGMAWAGKPDRFQRGDVILVREKKPGEATLDQEPDAEGALLAMESASGYVRAMVGGYDFARSQFNRATQALRQPGSAFKPLVYAAALDRGYTAASVVIDGPIIVDDDSKKLWRPENYDEKFTGATRFRDALTFSRNVVSVKIAQDIGLDFILSYLPRFGLVRPFPGNLSLVLGSSEMTLLELVRAYGVFATGGKLCEPIFITRITDRAGNVLEENPPSCEETISAETAYLMTSILKDVVQRGTAQRARALGRPVAGKTGTTNELMDAWFIGYTPDLVAGAWVGFDQKKTLGKKETGGRAALPVWLQFMQTAVETTPVTDFPFPTGIVLVNIDEQTGLLAPPEGGSTLLESFRRGTEPDRFAQTVVWGPGPNDFFRGDF